ncbi:ubiquitin c-terminal hydrolase [Teratosphaeria destructans]|uniref:ubiquitinyl hydrolase 1 n=1 Tax=Teratosphaeria destructans TaxID=418781 RepID=A0A9W7T2J0_9PEZI|nr:ubiquitin c-terminal hydrolase [Teratosphaeria destructans]
MLVSLTVGKVDAGVAVLLTEDKRLIEFPSILLPSDIHSGSIVDINVSRNQHAEVIAEQKFTALQQDILNAFGSRSPSPPVLRCRNATQTSVVLEWDPVDLATAELRSLSLYRNGSKAGNIPIGKLSTKISGLAMDTVYTFHLVLRTSAGQFTSEKVEVRTHKLTDLHGITITPGVMPSQLKDSLAETVNKIGAKMIDAVRIDTTHFVCTEPRGQAWEKAVEMNIPVVVPDWVKGCEREGRMVPARSYYLDADPSKRSIGPSATEQRVQQQARDSPRIEHTPPTPDRATHDRTGRHMGNATHDGDGTESATGADQSSIGGTTLAERPKISKNEDDESDEEDEDHEKRKVGASSEQASASGDATDKHEMLTGDQEDSEEEEDGQEGRGEGKFDEIVAPPFSNRATTSYCQHSANMAEIPIKVKHQGKVYDVEIDTNGKGEDLKVILFSITNVEPENQKVLAKKMVKDDTPLASLGLKPGQIITLMGSPSADVVMQAPKEKMKFAEDMTEEELAQQEGAIPAGLQNTGNTCYANATLQTLRSIPELQQELASYKPSSNSSQAGPSSSMFSAEQLAQVGIGGLGGGNDLTGALRDLYKQMSGTQHGFPPIMFLTTLRQKFPQFAERAKNGHGYAQQDAEEVWSQLIQTLHTSLKLPEGDAQGFKSFVDKYMGGKFEVTTTCDDAPEEESIINMEDFHDLKCNIQGDTNHLSEGLRIALNEKLEKNSPSLGREATYTRQSRISRLPKHLPIHLIRFFWRKDTQKKAKILRKVTFQHEIDVTEFCTEELRKKLIPVRDQIREVRKEEEDIERAKKRQKRMRKEQEEAAALGEGKVRSDEPVQKLKDKEKERENKAKGPASEQELKADKKAAGGDTTMSGTEEETFKTDEQIEKERAESILAAKKKLLEAVHPDLKKDSTANQTGLYELRAVVTHQGSSADSGHYTAYVKKTAPPGKSEDGKWWWFNDEKVSEVESEKIETLAGGGESHSALILLYRAVELPTLPAENGRKYGVATVWLVATLGSRSTLKRVSRKAILDVDVEKACETIMEPEAPMALRLQSNLLYGVTRVYAQQCGYVLNDAEAARSNMRAIFKVMRTAALESDERHKGRADQLVLPDDPNFLPDFDLIPMELDQLDLDVISGGALAAESQSSILSPHNSQATFNSINIPPGPPSYLIGGPAGRGGSLGIRGDSGSGHRASTRLPLEDEGILVDAEGEISIDEASSASRQAVAPQGPVERMQPGSASSIGQVYVGGLAGGDAVEQQYDDGFMPPADDFQPSTDVDNVPSGRAGLGGEAQEQVVSEESASSAPMRRRKQTAPKVMPPDTTLELRNGDLARWNTDYVANMQEANKQKQAARAAALAKENARHWVLGNDSLAALGHSDVLVNGPLEMFSGAKLLEALIRIRLTPGGQKRVHEDDDAENQAVPRKRSRDLNMPSDEIARGIDSEGDGGYMPAVGDDYMSLEVEQGREAATPLDDPRISGAFPWNQSTASRRPTGGLNSGSALGGGVGQQVGISHRRGSRLTSASPLNGRGMPGAATSDDLGQDLPIDAMDGQDFTGLDDFELFGVAAQVDTQTAGQSQWQRAALDSESENFLEFVKTGIEEADQARGEAALGDEEDDALRGSIDFEDLLKPDKNSHIVAAQGLLHVLALGTKNLLSIQQDEAFGPISMKLIDPAGP